VSAYNFTTFAKSIEDLLLGRDLDPEYEGGTWTGRFTAGSLVAELESLDEHTARLTVLERDILVRTVDLAMTAAGARIAADGIAAVFQFSTPDPFAEDGSDKRLCASCVSDHVLIGRIDRDGHEATCTYCHKRAKVVSISHAAEWINRVFESYARDAEDDLGWLSPGGQTPSQILQQDLGIEDANAADDLVDYLHAACGRRRPEDSDYYDKTSETFELAIPRSTAHIDAWGEFTNGVKHRTRFFNQHHEEYLRRIFEPLLAGSLTSGTAPIVELGPGMVITHIYRGREATSPDSLKRLYANPASEMAAPPPRHRRQGRMNAIGISVFYGSTDITTCVAELRPPVGSNVVAAKFELLRTVRLLDFRQLAGSSMPFSWFEDDVAEKVAYVEFMRRLHDEIRKPVLPGAEALEYLPTQIISEFLASRSGADLDGVLFTSSLTSRLHDETEEDADDSSEDVVDEGVSSADTQSLMDTGLNVVLFAHAAVVEGDRGGPVRTIGDMFSGRNKTQVVDALPVTAAPQPASKLLADYGIDPEGYEPTLRLSVDEPLYFVRVQAINYDLDAIRVVFQDRHDAPGF
jgi:RES domain-containing protein/HEPN superfamily RES-like protein